MIENRSQSRTALLKQKLTSFEIAVYSIKYSMYQLISLIIYLVTSEGVAAVGGVTLPFLNHLKSSLYVRTRVCYACPYLQTCVVVGLRSG